MALVNNGQKIVRKEIKQAERACAGDTSIEIAGIVLYPGAITYLLDHLQVISHPFVESLCLIGFPNFLKELHLFSQIDLYLINCPVNTLLGGDKKIRRKDAVRI
ncbi:hypothetical protein SDC9_170457 [bioreactor metagenome]|uniref:Uncharacterized protein n=1 Tax=bioreactor metagenome TaxID=1076179 RepID=A0A645GAS1_9ZZZZ